MRQRKSAKGEPCPIARSVDVVGDRWSLLIVRDVFDGLHRFGDFQRSLGVARNILTDRLRGLVEEGILETRPASDGSAYLEYVLTPKGESMFPVMVALRQWGERHLFGHGEEHSLLLDKETGKAIPSMAPHAADGRVLKPDSVEVKKVS